MVFPFHKEWITLLSWARCHSVDLLQWKIALKQSDMMTGKKKSTENTLFHFKERGLYIEEEAIIPVCISLWMEKVKNKLLWNISHRTRNEIIRPQLLNKSKYFPNAHTPQSAELNCRNLIPTEPCRAQNGEYPLLNIKSMGSNASSSTEILKTLIARIWITL